MIKSLKKFLKNREVSNICDKYNIEKWSINPDTGLVDVKGHVDLANEGLTKLPLHFGKVSGDFYCHGNKLTTLEGCPKEVGRYFNCHNNLLTSLEGCPNKVGGSFYCQNNQLISLEFAPKVIGNFNCGSNRIISLEGLQATSFSGNDNPVSNLTQIGRTMISKSISFPEAVSIHIKEIPDNELELVINTMDPQFILELNDFKIFNLLRTKFPKKYAEVMSLRDVDLSADLGELGF